jgi:hypothetical protein
MTMPIVIRGVHPINAPEPCHLIELQVADSKSIDWSAITQELADQPQENWQVPWDERPIDDDETRWAFFFHYLDLKKPLLTQDGPVTLPKPTPIPKHLNEIEYDPPG